MAADKIKVNFTSLSNDAEMINSYIGEIRKYKGNMEATVKALESMWEGEASKNFHAAFSDDMKVLDGSLKKVESLYQYDSNASKEYKNCENRVGELVKEIKISD